MVDHVTTRMKAAYPVPVGSGVRGLAPVAKSSDDAAALTRAMVEAEVEIRRLAAIVETSHDVIVTRALDGTITSWNAAAERVYGYSAEEVVGRGLEVVVPPEGRAEFLAAFDAIAKGSTGVELETTRETRDGRRFVVSLTISPLLDDTGAVVGASIIHRDVTGKKRGEEAIRQLAAIVESSLDAIVGRTVDGIVTSWNRGAEQLYGYSADEMIGGSVAKVMPDTGAELASISKRLLAGEHLEFEAPRVRKDGTTIEVWSTVSPIQDASGAIVGVSAISRDVTKQKRAEKEIRRLNRQLKAIVDSSPLAIAAIDLEYRLMMWNPAAERLFGWRSEEVLGARSPLVPPEEREFVRRMVGGVLSGATPPTVETTRLHKDGSRIDVAVSYAPLGGDDAGVTGTMAVLVDIREQKRAQEEVTRSLERLEHALDDRRRLLDELLRAQEDERRRIAEDIHDDSIQMLAALLLRLGMLRRELADPDHLQQLDGIEVAARESLHRLRGLMFELRPPELDRDGLAPALRLVLEQTRIDAALECSFESRLASEPDPGTRAIVYRICREALVNVRRHAQAKSVSVLLDDATGMVRARIADDGIGLSPDQVQHRPGHIGLDSMRERAEMAGGWFKLESAPGEGTVIEFAVPRAPEPVKPSQP